MDASSIQLPRRNISEGSLTAPSDRKSSPFLARRQFELSSNPVLTSGGASDPLAQSVSRGAALLDQITLSRHLPRRSADTLYPSLTRDISLLHAPLKTPPRTPILSSTLPTFRRPHSNPDLSHSKQYSAVSTDDLIEAKKIVHEESAIAELGNRSAPSVKGTTSVSTIIPRNNFGIHSYSNLKTSTPNDQIRSRNRFQPQEITTPISTVRQDISDSSISEFQNPTDPPGAESTKQPILSEEYLQSIRDLLAEKPPYLLSASRKKTDNNPVSNDEIPARIRAHHSEGASSTPRHNSDVNLNGKSTSMTTLMSVLEDLRFKNSKKSLVETKTLKLSQTAPNGLNAKSTPSLENVSRATSEKSSKDTIVSLNPVPQMGINSSENLQREDSFQILSTDQITEVILEREQTKYLSASSPQNKPPKFNLQPEISPSVSQMPSSVQMSESSSASFIKLNSELYLESQDEAGELGASRIENRPERAPTQPETLNFDDINKQCENVNNKPTKQSHALAVTTNKLTNNTTLTPLFTPRSVFLDSASPYPRFGLSDFTTCTPPTPSAFITDLDSQESLPSLEPRTIDCDTTLVPKNSEVISATNIFPLEKIPSHYELELLNSDSESETFLPLTPTEVQTQPDTPPPEQVAEPVERELEIVSLPQSSVASPNKQFLDTSSPHKTHQERSVEVSPSHDAARTDRNHETSLEYLNRFVEEVRKFMERRNGDIPHNVSKEIQVTINESKNMDTSPTIPPNIDQLITEIAREKLDSLWEDYIQNKIAVPHAPFLTPRKSTKLPHSNCESTYSGYNTRLTSSFSDTTLFVPKNIPGKLIQNKIHLVMKPRRKPTHKSRREGVKKVSEIPTQTSPTSEEQDTIQVPDKNVLSVKRNSIAFLISPSELEAENQVEPDRASRVSLDMSLQEACQSYNPRFVTNSHLRQIQLQKLRVWREEVAQQINLKQTANKSIQTLSNGRNQQVGSFVTYKRKLGPDEIQRQNQRWRKKFSLQKKRDETKIQRERGQRMRIRVKAYQKEILDPVRKSLSRHP